MTQTLRLPIAVIVFTALTALLIDSVTDVSITQVSTPTLGSSVRDFYRVAYLDRPVSTRV